MEKTIQKRQQKLKCPHCGKIFQAPQGLAGHIRFAHADKFTARKVQPEQKDGKRDTGVPIPVSMPNTGAHEHLKTALEVLMQRNREIEEQLARIEPLQAEKETVRKQIEAVNTAMQPFMG